jgi:hypothetical protein
MGMDAHGLACAIRCSRPDNEGWMTTTVEVKVPSFEGKFSCTLELNEWKQFIQVLRQLNNSIGSEMEQSWANMEANLGPTLSGSFEADQTFVAVWLQGAQTEIDG